MSVVTNLAGRPSDLQPTLSAASSKRRVISTQGVKRLRAADRPAVLAHPHICVLHDVGCQ